MLPPPTESDERGYESWARVRWLALIITIVVAAIAAAVIYFATTLPILAFFVTPPVFGLIGTLLYIGLLRYRVGTLIAVVCLLILGLLAVFSFVDVFRPWTTASVFIGLAVLIPLLMIAAWSGLFPALAELWNWNHKAFGGTIAGDMVNLIGVIALVNAHRALSGDGWWWMAMFAGFLALVVGASLQWRWLRNNDRDQIVPMMLNMIVAVCTVMSLFADPPMPADSFANVRWMVLSVWYAYLGGLLLFWIVMLLSNTARVRLGVQDNRLTTREKVGLSLLLVALYLEPIAALIGFPLWQMQNEIISLFIGAVGVLAWAATELFSALRRAGRWAHYMEDWTNLISYLEWEKNWWEAVAGYSILIYIIVDIVYKLRDANAVVPQEYETILILGLSLGALGSVRGILKGILAKPYRSAQASLRARLQPVREPNRRAAV